MNRNLRRELEALLQQLNPDAPPSLLLHSCCAPCSSYVLEYLAQWFRITVLYYNPNIYPPQEYTRRKEEQQRFIDAVNPNAKNTIAFVELPYHPEQFYAVAKGLEDAPEGGARCMRCYELRQREAASYAHDGGYDYFTTTLSISPHKNASALYEIGERLAAEYGAKQLPSDFKKKGGYLRSIELSRIHELYRQDYCGCEFSRQ